MYIARTTRPLLAAAGLALGLAACAPDAGTTTAGLTPTAPARLVGAIGSVFSVQLRTFPNDPLIPNDPVIPTDPLYGYGHLQLRLGSLVDDSCLPPSPITPQPGSTLLSVCGRILNEGGARYLGGEIYRMGASLGDGAVLVATFGGTLPPNPCRRYELAGATTVSDATAADMIANASRFLVRFRGDVAGTPTTMGGLTDGSAWGPVGTRPETDPYFAEKVCTVAVTP